MEKILPELPGLLLYSHDLSKKATEMQQQTSLQECSFVFTKTNLYIFFVFSVRVRKNSSVRSKKDSGDKKGQRLIEKEAMETGRVLNSN